jgi:hypothetical protein
MEVNRTKHAPLFSYLATIMRLTHRHPRLSLIFTCSDFVVCASVLGREIGRISNFSKGKVCTGSIAEF